MSRLQFIFECLKASEQCLKEMMSRHSEKDLETIETLQMISLLFKKEISGNFASVNILPPVFIKIVRGISYVLEVAVRRKADFPSIDSFMEELVSFVYELVFFLRHKFCYSDGELETIYKEMTIKFKIGDL